MIVHKCTHKDNGAEYFKSEPYQFIWIHVCINRYLFIIQPIRSKSLRGAQHVVVAGHTVASSIDTASTHGVYVGEQLCVKLRG